jgi:hypothetical protein
MAERRCCGHENWRPLWTRATAPKVRAGVQISKSKDPLLISPLNASQGGERLCPSTLGQVDEGGI